MTAPASNPFTPSMPGRLRVDIWSDIACPWCYIGKRRLETALSDFPQKDQVEVVWHSFELDPSAPVGQPEAPCVTRWPANMAAPPPRRRK